MPKWLGKGPYEFKPRVPSISDSCRSPHTSTVAQHSRRNRGAKTGPHNQKWKHVTSLPGKQRGVMLKVQGTRSLPPKSCQGLPVLSWRPWLRSPQNTRQKGEPHPAPAPKKFQGRQSFTSTEQGEITVNKMAASNSHHLPHKGVLVHALKM